MHLSKINFSYSVCLAGLALSGCSAPLAPETDDASQPAFSIVTNSGKIEDGGDCCVAANPMFPRTGCDNVTVESCVCGKRPECCSDNWSLACVGIALEVCESCREFSDEELAIAGLLGDSDGDGLIDLDEIVAALNPYNPYDGPDIDGDGIENGDDPDVDGDGIANAYDDDVDGDGIDNVDDDDIDGDGLLNRIQDRDDDGDGVHNLLDNDDDADGFPDRRDNDGDKDDDGRDDDEEECTSNRECGSGAGKICNNGECIPPADAASRGPVLEVNCSSDADCEGDEVCFVVIGDAEARPLKQCMTVDTECSEQDDFDRDGVCDDFDPDPDGNGDIDDDNDGIIDRDEIALGTDPNDFDSDNDFIPDGYDFAPLDDEIAAPDTTGTNNGGEDDGDEGTDASDPDEIENDDDENPEGTPTTENLDLTEDEDDGGLPIEPDGDEDDDDGSGS